MMARPLLAAALEHWTLGSCAACRLFRYEDAMYAHYPLRISPADAEATSTFANGLRFEFGGMMR